MEGLQPLLPPPPPSLCYAYNQALPAIGASLTICAALDRLPGSGCKYPPHCALHAMEFDVATIPIDFPCSESKLPVTQVGYL